MSETFKPYKIIFFEGPDAECTREVAEKVLIALSKGGFVKIDDDFVNTSSISRVRFCPHAQQMEVDRQMASLSGDGTKTHAEIMEARERYNSEYREAYLMKLEDKKRLDA